MVRHQLSLSSCRNSPAIRRFRLASTKAGRRISRGTRARLSDAARAARAGQLSCCSARREDAISIRLSLLDAPAPGLRRGAATDLPRRGAAWVQIDEPCLVLDLDLSDTSAPRLPTPMRRCRDDAPLSQDHADDLFRRARGQSRHRACAARRMACMSTSCAAPEQLACRARRGARPICVLVARRDRRPQRLERRSERASSIASSRSSRRRGHDRVQIAPSCSLLHTPIDLERETDLDPEVKAWLAFARAEDRRTRDAWRRRSPRDASRCVPLSLRIRGCGSRAAGLGQSQ